MNINELIKARFWSKVAVLNKNQCWLWKSALAPNGYGKFSINNYPCSAHRISFEICKGIIPEELVIDHICRNRSCVNPSHLRAVTYRINNIENSDSVAAKNINKTHCAQGHEYSKDNTKIRKSKARECRICIKTWKQNHTKRARAFIAKMDNG